MAKAILFGLRLELKSALGGEAFVVLAGKGVGFRQAVVAALQAIACAFDIAACALGARERLAQPRASSINSSRVRPSIGLRSPGTPTLCQYPHIGTSTELLDSRRRPSLHPLNKDLTLYRDFIDQQTGDPT